MNYIHVTGNEWECRLGSVETPEVQEFFDWLQGKATIERMHFEEPPKLSKQAAFSVIYYLQERLGILADSYELCKECGNIYDSDNEGIHITSDTTIIDAETGDEVEAKFSEDMYGNYCDDCRPD